MQVYQMQQEESLRPITHFVYSLCSFDKTTKAETNALFHLII